jgi:hypothetical protein
MKLPLLLMIQAMLLLPCVARSQSFNPAAPACGQANVEFKVSEDHQTPDFRPDPAKAVVFIAESFSDYLGDSTKPILKLSLNGRWIGATQSDSWLSFTVDPGEQHLCIQWQSSMSELYRPIALQGFTAEAGRVYYFRSQLIYRANRGSKSDFLPTLSFDPVNPDEAHYLILSSPHDVSNGKVMPPRKERLSSRP